MTDEYSKEVERFAEVVEDMILQLSYPGFDERSLKLGLPDEINKYQPKVYAKALRHESRLVKLAALRWFIERPGMAKSHMRLLSDCLTDQDEWVRKETVQCIERLEGVPEDLLVKVAELLKDGDRNVRKASAKCLGKIGGKSQAVIDALTAAAEDSDHEVRWKAQKALRKLGAYVA